MKNKPKNKTHIVLPMLLGLVVLVSGAVLTTSYGNMLMGKVNMPKTPFPTFKPTPPTTSPKSCVLDPKQLEELLKELDKISIEITLLQGQLNSLVSQFMDPRLNEDQKNILMNRISILIAKLDALYKALNEKRGGITPECGPEGPTISL